MKCLQLGTIRLGYGRLDRVRFYTFFKFNLNFTKLTL